jgi:predicted MPP superfamily phosphohydrolase
MVTAALILSTLLDAVVVGWVLLRPGQVGLRRVWLAFVAGCVAFGPKAMLLTTLAGSLFFLVNLAYVDLVVLLPVLGLATLAGARRREVARPVRAIAWLSLALVPTGLYATFYEPFRLVTERVSVPIAERRDGDEPLRVAVLADIQSCAVTDHLRDAVRRAMEFEPHLILLPGDLMQCPGVEARERAIPQFRELLSALDAPMGVYFVLGNTDRAGTVLRALEGTHVRLLQDEIVPLTYGDRRVAVAGSDFGGRGVDFVQSLERRPDDGEILILLTHYPDAYLFLDEPSRVDLVVAGHTHGGQIVLPLIGPPVTLSRVPRRVAAGGLHDIGGRRVYVSRGIGVERAAAPRVRFNCPPEVSLLTLE